MEHAKSPAKPTEPTAAPVGVRALGVLQNDPLRGPVALRLLETLISVPADADAVGSATLVDGNALLSRVKLPAPGEGDRSLSHLIGAPRGRAAVMQIGTGRELRPGGDPSQNLGPFRARNYAAAVVGGPQDPDVAAALRDNLVADLPDFLRRCVAGKSEAEAFFVAVLSRLHTKGLLEAAYDNGGALVEAVRFVDESCQKSMGEAAAGVVRHVTLTNGVEVLHAARGLPSAVVTVAGLAEDVAAELSPLFVDSSTARERNRRYRGVFCLGALDVTLKASTTPPRGTTLQVLPPEAAVLVARDLTVRVL